MKRDKMADAKQNNSEKQLIIRPVDAINGNQVGDFIKVESTTTEHEEYMAIVLVEDSVEYKQSRFQRFIRHMEKLLGFRIQFFSFSDSIVRPTKFLIDKGQRILYIHIDYLKMPFKKFQRLMKELLTLSQADNRLLRAFGNFSSPLSLFGRNNSCMKLVVGETGLLMPPDMKLLAVDYRIRVTISDIEVVLRFQHLRLMYQSTQPLPFYAYVIDLNVVDDVFVVPLPPDALQILSSSGTMLLFQVYYDGSTR